MTEYNPIDKTGFVIRQREMENFLCVFEKENSKMPIIVDCTGITFPAPDYFVSRKDCNFYAFEYLIEGKGHLIYNDKEYTLEAGDFWCFEPHSSLRYYSDKNAPMKKYFVVFYCDLMDKIFAEFGLSNIILFKNCDVSSHMLRIFEIIDKAEHPPVNDKVAILVLEQITQITIELYKHQNKSSESTRAVAGTAYQTKLILDQSITSAIKINDISKMLFKSRSSLNNDFARAYGVTPYQYILSKKIEFAQSLLINTNHSVKEITKILAFADPYYFSNIFKVKVGISPTAFRKKHH
jgi:AraC-like DNA-binding protein